MAAEDVTLAVLGTKVDTLTTMIAEVREEQRTTARQALDRRVTTVEENIKWVTRTLVVMVVGVVGSVITALVTR